MKEIKSSKVSQSISIDLILYKSTDGTFYWKFTLEDEERENDKDLFVMKEDLGDTKDLVLILYNEAVMGSLMTSFATMSVIGVYIAVVLAVGRFLRVIFDRYSERVMFEELPNTSKLFEICEGIFIAQLEGDLRKEKRLYDLLIYIYRSPHLMIEITGTKQHYLPED